MWSWIYCNPVRLLVPPVSATGLLDITRFSGPAFMNIIPGKKHPGCSGTLLEIIQEYTRAKPHFRESIRGLLLHCMVQLHRICVPQGAAQRATSGRTPGLEKLENLQRIAPALDHIHACFRRKISLQELARVCCMSQTNFRRIFSQVMGVSPFEYLTVYRINAAGAELTASGKSVEAIAAETGFNDPSGFRKAFKHHTGITARQWRQKEHAPLAAT
jgi:AraC-like DNA-binding protein